MVSWSEGTARSGRRGLLGALLGRRGSGAGHGERGLGGLLGDEAAFDELRQVLVEGLAAELFATVGHVSAQVARPGGILDRLAHAGCGDQDFDGSNPTLVISLGQELLRDDRAQGLGEAHAPDLALLAR